MRSFWSAKPGAGEQVLPLDCTAKAHVKIIVFTDTGVIIDDAGQAALLAAG